MSNHHYEFAGRQRWELNGITPGDADAARQLKLSQPSLRDHQDEVKRLDNALLTTNISLETTKGRIDRDRDYYLQPEVFEKYESTRQHYSEMLIDKERMEKSLATGNNHLGHVFAASGYRSTDGAQPSQLDWALINVAPSRLGVNKVEYVKDLLATEC